LTNLRETDNDANGVTDDAVLTEYSYTVINDGLFYLIYSYND